jgi:hypothetical protein
MPKMVYNATLLPVLDVIRARRYRRKSHLGR